MKSVDVDIYVSQVVRFFETNPNELKTLIGNLNKNDFFDKIKEIAYENFKKGEDVTLTKSQIIQIVLDIFNEKQEETLVEPGFMRTKYGDICMN
jgi:hypothetical protein